MQLIAATRFYAADYVVRLYADPFLWQAWAFLAVNVALVGSGVYALAERRYLVTVFVGWFYIFLLPVVHILPINQLLADRYALLPSLSWCALLGWGLAWLWTYAGTRFSAGFTKLVAGIGLFFVLLIYGLMTLTQNMVWLNSQLLWENTLKVTPTSSSANVNLSVIYIEQGRLKEAEELCITAIKRLPYDYLAISNLALAQLLQGQYDNALNNYTQALKLKPDLIKARLGRERAAWLKRDWQQAYAFQQELIDSYGAGGAEQAPVVWHHRGLAAVKLGRQAEGLKALRRADELAAANPQVWVDLGETYTSLGLKAEAAAVYRKTLPLLVESPFKQGIRQRIAALGVQ
ncbi:MAG: Tetratricopeptide repeat protein [Deltaproteobacteria bacterium ADurb.Bin510]|nr:MAG: Tetratricopeptide repeat protein [Deltaproteobacteria bacterium ADurb.Bin510]